MDDTNMDDGARLTRFLLARIAEDEEVAEMAGHGFGHQSLGAKRNAGWTDIDETENRRPSYDAGFITRQNPDRVLRECEAKRRRVELLSTWDRLCPPGDWPVSGDMSGVALADAGRFLLRVEALPYCDHPDYDEGAWHL